MDNQPIKLKSKDGEIIEFDHKIINLSIWIKNAPNFDEIIPVELSSDSLKFILKFMQVHDYEESSMNYKFPFESDILKDHIDEKSYELFKQFNTSDIKENAKKLAPLLDAGFFLDIKKFRKICNVTLQIPLFCGTTEEQIKNFKEKWGITEEDLSPENQRKIMEENKPVFDAIKKKYQEQLDELQRKAEEAKQD
ncbi:hypothetical protein IMG5_185500 [Ichthyophthirius multifiliis]|uniref:Uncharacterized protein n=1 Tax=Ichthyophthirius multifiliis TaxID=5932 RepID=G0R3H8_ICHMU|nr:hypothetical protein IMG5_185500 [Ichthyophthirius multifiliis]EGR27967.1 hypothetical protein IMG5_185500 [Ichthyophthirius multifiliis]|eukprot:XP_004027312.1 hypothetical protein IMG5_185500 [Ichthyophthirius multifiliis]